MKTGHQVTLDVDADPNPRDTSKGIVGVPSVAGADDIPVEVMIGSGCLLLSSSTDGCQGVEGPAYGREEGIGNDPRIRFAEVSSGFVVWNDMLEAHHTPCSVESDRPLFFLSRLEQLEIPGREWHFPLSDYPRAVQPEGTDHEDPRRAAPLEPHVVGENARRSSRGQELLA